MKMDLCPL